MSEEFEINNYTELSELIHDNQGNLGDITDAVYDFYETKLKDLQHYKDTTIGMFATDRPDLVNDPLQVLFELKQQS
jgi:hypothetical protein